MSAPEPRDLLAAYRAERGPTRAQAEELWTRLRHDVAAPPQARAEARRRVVSSRDPDWGRGRGRAVAIAAVVLAAAAVAVLALRPSGRDAQSVAASDRSLSSHEAHPDAEGAVTETRERATRVQPQPQSEQAPVQSAGIEPAPEIETPSSSSTRAPLRRAATKPPASEIVPEPATDSLAEETSLLRRARAALSKGRASDALELLGDYDRRFPSGRLVEEADAVRTMARCRQAPADPGALAQQFVTRHRGSLFRKQVEAACERIQ